MQLSPCLSLGLMPHAIWCHDAQATIVRARQLTRSPRASSREIITMIRSCIQPAASWPLYVGSEAPIVLPQLLLCWLRGIYIACLRVRTPPIPRVARSLRLSVASVAAVVFMMEGHSRPTKHMSIRAARSVGPEALEVGCCHRSSRPLPTGCGTRQL
jgi:hypothetical protein